MLSHTLAITYTCVVHTLVAIALRCIDQSTNWPHRLCYHIYVCYHINVCYHIRVLSQTCVPSYTKRVCVCVHTIHDILHVCTYSTYNMCTYNTCMCYHMTHTCVVTYMSVIYRCVIEHVSFTYISGMKYNTCALSHDTYRCYHIHVCYHIQVSYHIHMRITSDTSVLLRDTFCTTA